MIMNIDSISYSLKQRVGEYFLKKYYLYPLHSKESQRRFKHYETHDKKYDTIKRRILICQIKTKI